MDRKRLHELRDEIIAFPAKSEFPDDRYVLICLKEAVRAGLEGNAAVGAVLVGPDGEVVCQERNRVFYPYFRSDFHAEMTLLTRFEKQRKGSGPVRGYTLFSSLEPCEMCLIRIIGSGVRKVYYAAADSGEGPNSGLKKLGERWQDVAGSMAFQHARCSPRLIEIGLELFTTTIDDILRKLRTRR